MDTSVSTELETLVLFEKYCEKYGKFYSEPELSIRLENFEQSLALIANHPKASSYTIGLNRFSDWTEEEKNERLFGNKPISTSESIARKSLRAPSPFVDFPSVVDYRTTENPFNRTAVTSVKDQGNCGACWAFSTAAAIETIVALDSPDGILNSLSAQQLVDCDNGAQSCNGGAFPSAFSYSQLHGLDLNSDYPYTGQVGTCQSSAHEPAASIDSWVSLIPCSFTIIQSALLSSAVSISLDASCSSFQAYNGGIYDTDCGTDVDHAITLVGYNSIDSYLIAKNSWGSDWGNGGYIYMKMDDSYQCGICDMYIDPTVPVGGVALVNSSFSDDDVNKNNSDDNSDNSLVIGLSVGVIVIGLAGIGLCLCISNKNKKRKSGDSYEQGLLN